MLGALQPRHIWLALCSLVGGGLIIGSVLIMRRPAVLGSGYIAAPAPSHAAPTQMPVLAPILPTATPPAPTTTPTASPTATATATPLPAFEPDGVERTVRVPVLMYHYVSGLPADADIYRRDLTVSPEAFERQLAYLQGAGYTGISLETLVRHLATGSPLPSKPIVLTFDDGYADNYLYAFPLLRQYGFAGTFFVITGFLDEGRGGYMSWEQARTMQKNGMDIQPHSIWHVDLRTLSADELAQELSGSRRAVEEHVGKPAHLFAYPSGRYNRRTIEALRDAGYWGAVVTTGGVEHSSTALFEIKRVRIHGGDTVEDIQATLAAYD